MDLGFITNWLSSSTQYDPKEYLPSWDTVISRLPQIELPSLVEIPSSLWKNKEWTVGVVGGVVILVVMGSCWKRGTAKIVQHPPVTAPPTDIPAPSPTPEPPQLAVKTDPPQPPVPASPTLKPAPAPPPADSAKGPIVELGTSLNIGTLSIAIPKEKVAPPNVTFTWCIDRSYSMNKEMRAIQVKMGVKKVFDSVQQVVDSVKGAQFETAVVLFNKTATTYCKPTKISPSTQRGVHASDLKEALEKYESEGDTDIPAGLLRALEELKAMAKRNRDAINVLSLLTDGEGGILDGWISDYLSELSALNVVLFVIGIGAKHEKVVMQAIANISGEYGEFSGTYIDTTQKGVTIDGAITKIYDQVINPYSHLTLRSSIPAGTWSVDKIFSIKKDNQSVFVIGALQQASQKHLRIKVHGKKLKESVDLSKVQFQLTGIDSRGENWHVTLHWNPTPIMNPTILNPSSQ